MTVDVGLFIFCSKGADWHEGQHESEVLCLFFGLDAIDPQIWSSFTIKLHYAFPPTHYITYFNLVFIKYVFEFVLIFFFLIYFLIYFIFFFYTCPLNISSDPLVLNPLV